MKHREELNADLKTLCPNVYYQPTQNTKLIYPAILYSLASYDPTFANNKRYVSSAGYTLIVITKKATDTLPIQILEKFTNTQLMDTYVSDNLYHYIINLYYMN